MRRILDGVNPRRMPSHLLDLKAESSLGEPQDFLRVDRVPIALVAEHGRAKAGVNLQGPYLELFAGNASILQQSFQLGPLFIRHDSTFFLILSL